jgi:hypothetical protein
MIDKDILKCVLSDHGWEMFERQPDRYYWRYERNGDLFDFWFTTGTCRLIVNNMARHYRGKTIEEITELIK